VDGGDTVFSNATCGVGRGAAAASAAAAIVASDASISSTLPHVVIVDAIVVTSFTFCFHHQDDHSVDSKHTNLQSFT